MDEKVTQLSGKSRVRYAHFDTSRDLFTGVMLASKHHALGISLLIQPDAGQSARYPRWRSIRDVAEFLPARIAAPEIEKATA